MKRSTILLLRFCMLSLLILALAGCATAVDAPRQGSGVEAYGEIDVGIGSRR